MTEQPTTPQPTQTKYDITATIQHTLTQQQEQQLKQETTKRGWQLEHIITYTRCGRTQYVQDTTTHTEIDLIIPALRPSFALEKTLRLLRHNGIHDIVKIELPCY